MIMMTRKYLGDSYFLLQKKNIYRYGHLRPISTQTSPKDVKPFKSVPGLSSIPFLGPLHHFLPVVGDIGPRGQLFDKLGQLHAKYGPIVKMAGIFERPKFVILFEPEHFKQVYEAEETSPTRPSFQALTYYREEMRQSTFQGVYGLATAQGPKWREFRTKVNPAMLKLKLVKIYTPGLEEIAEDMVARISKLKDQTEMLQNNFELEMTKWSLESIALVGLGARLGCLRDELTADHPASKLIESSRDIFDLTFKLELKPSPWKYISTPNFKKIIKVFDTQWDVSSIYVNEAMNRINSRSHDVPEEDKSIIEKLLAIDKKVAIMMASEMLVAGIDTVNIMELYRVAANGFSYVAFTTMSLLYHLAVNQNVQDKLRQEIRSGNSSQYLRACLKESLRIWPAIPANLRRTSKEHIVGGYHIPKDVHVLAPNQYLSNLEKYYSRPQEFLPDRWLAVKSDPIYYGNAHPLVNLPFGFGIRSCIGRRIAELELKIFFKKLINELKVTWNGPPAKVKSSLFNVMEKPYCIKFESVN